MLDSLLAYSVTFLWSSFLVGEGARIWAKSKGIALPTTIAEADEVISFTFLPICQLILHPLLVLSLLIFFFFLAFMCVILFLNHGKRVDDWLVHCDPCIFLVLLCFQP